ncbi:MAG: trypsin-like peptidase domain-containing protein [Anaerolineales bacterium]|nr:MAG: trypsin-like peptidase domain-containing protein [Anaerolineales bacterium]
MQEIDAGTLSAVLAAKQNHLQNLLKRPNTVACGIGYKVTDEGPTDELSVVVSVTRKLPLAQLAESDLVPRMVDGIKTDVIETGTFRAFQSHRDRWRPVVPPGVSLGHINVTAGTFGCLVRRGNELFILSNNHVLANANQGQAGDSILQPGRHDGGTLQDQIATLADYVPLDFGGKESTCNLAGAVEKGLNAMASAAGSRHRILAYQQTSGNNQVDAALARVNDPSSVTPEIFGIGRPLGIRQAALGTPVKKSGRTTGYTEGRIIQIDVTSQVAYGPGQATFHNQLMADGMSGPGDSGSAVLDMQNYVTGLLFAGSETATLINPIQTVLRALDVEIVT